MHEYLDGLGESTQYKFELTMVDRACSSSVVLDGKGFTTFYAGKGSIQILPTSLYAVEYAKSES